MLLDGPGLLLAAALAGLPLAIRRRCTDTLILWLALVPTFLHAAFLIPRGPQERYGLTLILVMAVLAAQGVAPRRGRDDGVPGTPSRPSGGPPGCRGRGRARRDAAGPPGRLPRRRAGRALAPRGRLAPTGSRRSGIGPDDILMTDVPTIVGWYVGGVDFWISSRDYEKYTTRPDDVRRDVHTGAALIRQRSDFERLVGRPLAGQAVWVISSGRSYQWGELVDDDLKAFLDRSASQRVNPGDNFRVLLLNLPSGS